MELGVTVASGIALAVGVFFAFVGVVGILRFPDFFARSQAATCITTLGTIGAMIAALIYAVASGYSTIVIVKLLVIGLMIVATSAVSGHALEKGNYRRGHRATGGFAEDDYGKDGFNEN
ncbi:MAG: monovalent cation/H(+) antiporter subunit G [Faecalibacterium sp.]|jgi:multicomponent Na+:H+ antiporter subunit G|nr:monovalent cation/H(+) antiporter subunit G [Faecalibacterium sp.]